MNCKSNTEQKNIKFVTAMPKMSNKERTKKVFGYMAVRGSGTTFYEFVVRPVWRKEKNL